MAGVKLSSFLQMIEMEQKTCIVKVFTKKNLGQIFFQKGEVVDALTVKLKHLDALYDILSWDDIVLEVKKNEVPRPNAVNLPLIHILIESARLNDEDKKPAEPEDGAVEGRSPAGNQSRAIVEPADFCLEIGVRLRIDFDDVSVPFQSSLVGIEHGRYLLLKAPIPFETRDEATFTGTGMVVKTLYRGTIYAFRSRLNAMIAKPSRLMFIEYPKKIEHHELRSHRRFKCSIVAQASLNQGERGAVIENISKGGCACVIETYKTDPDLSDSLLRNTILFRCRFPGSDGEVCFMGEVKNIKERADEISAGVEFVYPEDGQETREVIANYIQLIEYAGQGV